MATEDGSQMISLLNQLVNHAFSAGETVVTSLTSIITSWNRQHRSGLSKEDQKIIGEIEQSMEQGTAATFPLQTQVDARKVQDILDQSKRRGDVINAHIYTMSTPKGDVSYVVCPGYETAKVRDVIDEATQWHIQSPRYLQEYAMVKGNGYVYGMEHLTIPQYEMIVAAAKEQNIPITAKEDKTGRTIQYADIHKDQMDQIRTEVDIYLAGPAKDVIESHCKRQEAYHTKCLQMAMTGQYPKGKDEMQVPVENGAVILDSSGRSLTFYKDHLELKDMYETKRIPTQNLSDKKAEFQVLRHVAEMENPVFLSAKANWEYRELKYKDREEFLQQAKRDGIEIPESARVRELVQRERTGKGAPYHDGDAYIGKDQESIVFTRDQEAEERDRLIAIATHRKGDVTHNIVMDKDGRKEVANILASMKEPIHYTESERNNPEEMTEAAREKRLEKDRSVFPKEWSENLTKRQEAYQEKCLQMAQTGRYPAGKDGIPIENGAVIRDASGRSLTFYKDHLELRNGREMQRIPLKNLEYRQVQSKITLYVSKMKNPVFFSAKANQKYWALDSKDRIKFLQQTRKEGIEIPEYVRVRELASRERTGKDGPHHVGDAYLGKNGERIVFTRKDGQLVASHQKGNRSETIVMDENGRKAVANIIESMKEPVFYTKSERDQPEATTEVAMDKRLEAERLVVPQEYTALTAEQIEQIALANETKPQVYVQLGQEEGGVAVFHFDLAKELGLIPAERDAVDKVPPHVEETQIPIDIANTLENTLSDRTTMQAQDLYDESIDEIFVPEYELEEELDFHEEKPKEKAPEKDQEPERDQAPEPEQEH